MSYYIDIEDLKKSLNLQGFSFADADLERDAGSASDAIDEICGRAFGRTEDSNGEVRYFTPARASGVEVDDLLGVFDLKVGGSSWTDDQWKGWPLNAASKGRPWQEVRAVSPNAFRAGALGSVEITGIFGWASVPTQVVSATNILTVKLTRRIREAPFGFVMGAGDAGGTVARIARNDPDVMMLLGPFIKTTLLA